MKIKLGFVLSFFFISTLLHPDTVAQIRPVYDRGAMGLAQILKRLNTSASVLMIGAHPDDEDTALLTYLARGENARTAYLSLTRGDGGQNILGAELGESLGLIRTEELIQARKLDGAQQFFGRAYDYGFSKTLVEAKQKWDEKIVLCDTVRVIREFRPLVVVSQFSGTTGDGHGQHQYAGYISPLAVSVAADMNQCTSSGTPWKVAKFYARHRGAGEPRLRINTGKYDPILGRSYFEIAMEARSQHRSQEQGVLELKGDQFSSLNLAGSTVKEAGIFESLDTSLAGLALSGSSDMRAVADAADAALREFDPRNPARILPHLAKGYLAATNGKLNYSPNIDKSEFGRSGFYTTKQDEFAAAIKLAAGIQLDAIADRETVVPGDTISVNAKVFLGEKPSVKVLSTKLVAPAGWKVDTAATPTESANQGFFRRDTGDFAAFYSVAVPRAERPSSPYWLRSARDGDLFRWDDGDRERGLPFHSSFPYVEVRLEVLGTEVLLTQPVEYRYADDTRGEIRRNVNVVPAVSIELDQSTLIVPYSEKPQKRRLTVTVINLSNKAVSGTADLNMNGDKAWSYSSDNKTFELKRKGETATIGFDVTVPAKAKPGSYQIVGQAAIGDGVASSTMHSVVYPHIQTHRIYRKAAVDVRVFDLKIAPVRIGYVSGSGDRVPEAIKQMGFSVEMIDEPKLASGNLAGYDAIVVGIRASEVRPDFVANNTRLLNYAKNGGTVIVQYQRPVYAQQGLTPYPAQMGPRVADENAAVKILVPDHPIFNFPNTITDADFTGWVQERNLYNFSTMDEKYVGLLESHDVGEPENKGGLVVADVGKGKFVYCSYSLFRQLPAGVSGAYRLLANMLSLPKAKK